MQFTTENDYQRSYEQEKRFEKSRLFLQKESEFSQVNRLINTKYKDLHNIEFDTVFKMYKIQCYKLTPALFKGTSYAYGTLSSIRTLVKQATAGNESYRDDSTYRTLYDFIQDIKIYSKPFPNMFEKKRSAIDLLNSGALIDEEKTFLTSEIKSIRKMNKDERIIKMMKGRGINRLEKDTQEKVYTIVANNYKKSKAEVAKLIHQVAPQLSLNTVSFYISVCRRLERSGAIKKSNASAKLIEAWKNRNKDTIKVSSTNSVKTRSYGKKVHLSNEERDKIYDIIINNYNKGIPEVTSLVHAINPNFQNTTVGVYTAACKRLEKGDCEVSNLSRSFYKKWLERDSDSIKLDEKETKTVDINQIYALVSNNNIIEFGTSLDYLKGFMKGFEKNSNEMIKLYQLTEIDA